MERSGDAKDRENWIEQQIREAQERGAFDNLPGKGKPLDLTTNPYAQDWELAFKILKDAGCAPEWIELDKTIRSRLEKARATLARRWEWHENRLAELTRQSGRWAQVEREQVQASWHQAVVEFEQEIAAINREITELNLKVPAPRFQRFKVDAAREIERITEKRDI